MEQEARLILRAQKSGNERSGQMNLIILLLIIGAICSGGLDGILTLFILGFIGMMFFGGGSNVVGVINLNDK